MEEDWFSSQCSLLTLLSSHHVFHPRANGKAEGNTGRKVQNGVLFDEQTAHQNNPRNDDERYSRWIEHRRVRGECRMQAGHAALAIVKLLDESQQPCRPTRLRVGP